MSSTYGVVQHTSLNWEYLSIEADSLRYYSGEISSMVSLLNQAHTST